MKALLALADGTVFEGEAFGASGETVGEIVFNTSLSGYQEILTDPSYKGQIVTMTYPHIGNYGVNGLDVESPRPWVEGFIVREGCREPSNWRAEEGLETYLQRHGIVGIQGIDTRELTVRLRDQGSQEGVISTIDLDPKSLVAKAKASPGLVGRDLVREVTCPKPYAWTEGLGEWDDNSQFAIRNSTLKVVAYDFGIKRNILRMLVASKCEVTVVPASTPASAILAMHPDGVFLSNGPGDPEGVPYAMEAVRTLLGKKPIFGICLGHQILGLAFGGRTYKLKFGHHGGNHPVQDLTTRRIEITAQNHNFAVDPQTLPSSVEITHLNLNDRTVEGMRHRELPAFSVQYHPEASPGPHDARYLFGRFVEMMRENSKFEIRNSKF
ncbi:MAG: glutamine-hydrolyzing carbamoyl-phosphate synthase small subunit [Nitrospirae bacterium]|nr:glutamine-hydrolyzing carbamoyl-phosphate synthase small subunit [Nitrospirota bacterium]